MPCRRKVPRSLATPILIAAIILIFIFTGGSLWNVFARFHNTLYYTEICTGSLGENEIELQIIDVGQGDCALIRSAYGNILIDSGLSEKSFELKAHLDHCGIEKIDYFFCSHAHSDHIGGADMILQNYEVERLILPRSTESSFMLDHLLNYAKSIGLYPTYASKGDVYVLGDITITVLYTGDSEGISNDDSLVMKITFGEADFLFTGDISDNVEYYLLDEYGEDMLDCEFLKLAHHGSDTSSSVPFLAAVTPDIASASCQRNNDYGHPRGEVLHRLKLVGCENILRTDKMGTCIIRSDGNYVRFTVSHELYG